MRSLPRSEARSRVASRCAHNAAEARPLTAGPPQVGVEETAMRKVLVLVAIATLALAGVLIAAPKGTINGHRASVATCLDILGITQKARDLPEQSYPAH